MMGLKSIPNLLYQRLSESLQNGNEIRIRTRETGFVGIPIHLDEEFVEVVYLHVSEADARDESPYARTVWLIKLSEITAVAYPMQSWSKKDLESLLHAEKLVSDTDQR
ncbi:MULTISPECIES: hypothetical protein [unclassified Leptolyngbya]|uniref:hypothetical protein n=1 Tax=unclassified Leptolyngbya TaxID=2650499 RepID=UPI001685C675|nr:MULTISPECIES: hypothetical protein [unclassified Leptolyngbya]MBD1913791.1 hypothetical protein [Leptolyngbya sp. FACHB-8]MBD2153607.1 hypothetical protein [Leptolyngbya sp. FACHB-16]